MEKALTTGTLNEPSNGFYSLDSLNTWNRESSNIGSISTAPTPPKPTSVAPYVETKNLPDCIIVRKGKDNGDWYKDVTCEHCESQLLTRVVTTSINGNTVRFWCPVCKKESQYTNKAIREYDPMVLRHPALTACLMM